MTTLATVVLAALGGGVLGLAYFALLARSVRRLVRADSAPVVAVASLGLRLALAAAAFLAAVRGGGGPALVAALAGFLAVRTVVTWRRPPPVSAGRHP
ncbi:MAG TPA: ATP synthase subunit I [Gammaproteobacteria bacterium]|jgi:F1F0 ATPase subunit 2|nr:ATP synthase subunit I [Gammaproteobacteria bacterium]